MIKLYLSYMTNADIILDTFVYDIDEETLSVVNHRYGKKKQELFKSLLNSFIIDDVSSIKYISKFDYRTQLVICKDHSYQTDAISRNDEILTIVLPHAFSYINGTNNDSSYVSITTSYDVYRSLKMNIAKLYFNDFIKLLKAQHKDEVLSYLLLTGYLK